MERIEVGTNKGSNADSIENSLPAVPPWFTILGFFRSVWVNRPGAAERPGLHPGLQSDAPAGLSKGIPSRLAISPGRGGTHEPGVKPLAERLRQLTDTRGLVIEPDGTIIGEFPGPSVLSSEPRSSSHVPDRAASHCQTGRSDARTLSGQADRCKGLHPSPPPFTEMFTEEGTRGLLPNPAHHPTRISPSALRDCRFSQTVPRYGPRKDGAYSGRTEESVANQSRSRSSREPNPRRASVLSQ